MSRLSSRIIDALALCLPKTEPSRLRRFTSRWYVQAQWDDVASPSSMTRQSAGARAISLASLRVTHISMQNCSPDHIQVCVLIKGSCLSFSLFSIFLSLTRALFVFPSDSRAPENCKIHYGITARSKLIVSFCVNSDIGNRILPAQSKQTVNWKQLHFGNNETTSMQKGRLADEGRIRSFHSNSKFYFYFYINFFELKDFNDHNQMLFY